MTLVHFYRASLTTGTTRLSVTPDLDTSVAVMAKGKLDFLGVPLRSQIGVTHRSPRATETFISTPFFFTKREATTKTNGETYHHYHYHYQHNNNNSAFLSEFLPSILGKPCRKQKKIAFRRRRLSQNFLTIMPEAVTIFVNRSMSITPVVALLNKANITAISVLMTTRMWRLQQSFQLYSFNG